MHGHEFTAGGYGVHNRDQCRVLTGLYVPLVPLLGWILYKRRAHWVVWPAAVGCLIGTWLLTGAGAVDLNVGDLWVLATVIPFTLHVLWVDGRILVCSNSRFTHPADIYRVRLDDSFLRTKVPGENLSHANDELRAELNMSQPESVTVTGADGDPNADVDIVSAGF